MSNYINKTVKLKLKLTLGENRGFVVAGFKQFTQKLYNIFSFLFIKIFKLNIFNRNGTSRVFFKYKNGALSPIFTNSVNYQLDTNLVGQLKYKTNMGFNSSMSTSLVYQQESYRINLTLQLNVKNSFISCGFNKSLMNNSFKFKSAIQYGYTGTTFSYGIEKQLTEFSKVDASIIVNSMTGVILNLEYRPTYFFIYNLQIKYI